LVHEELDLLQVGQTLISTLNLPNLEKEYFDILLKKRITGIGFEFLEDKAGDLPVVRAMSEIAGSSSVLIASEYLSTERKGQGMLLGGITGVPPASVVIIGAGTVAEYAARTALGLGAEVKVFDTHLYRLQRLKYAVGHGVYTSIIDSVSLSKALCEADVVIGSMRAEKGLSPMVVDESMVKKMKEGSVIIDVAIDHGGCIETSRMTSLEKPVFIKHGVFHYCVPNIASRVAHTASTALSNIFTPTVIKIGNLGGVEEMILSNQWFMKGVYAYKGNVTNMFISKKYNLRYRELGLLLAARF
jgi:alanine dehydrogenase